MFIRRLLAVLIMSILTVPIASVAHAEGSWASSFSGWLTGSKTRTWENKKNNANNILDMKQCQFTTESVGGGLKAKSVHMELQRQDTWTPDENYGQKKLNCTAANKIVSGNWGKRGKGKFNYVLRKVNGTVYSQDHLHCKFIRAKY